MGWASQPAADIGLLAEICHRTFWPGLNLTAPDSDAIMAEGPHCSHGEQPNKALAALLGAIRDQFGLQHERTAYLPPNVKQWRKALRSYHEALEDAKDDETDAAGYRASDRYFAFTEKIFPNPAKTLADVLLIAEIATDIVDGPTEPGQIYPDDDLAGFTDVTVLAHLVRAVLDVIGGQNERERRARQLELQKICNDREAVDSGAKAADRVR